MTNSAQNERIRRIRQQWLDENGPCRLCGATENLEVDHIDPSLKDKRIAGQYGKVSRQNLWYWSKARREVELIKCQVLCEDCHKIKTRNEQRKEVCVNGHAMTPNNIITFPCKPTMRECRACRNAKSAAYRVRKRSIRDIHSAPRFVEFS